MRAYDIYDYDDYEDDGLEGGEEYEEDEGEEYEEEEPPKPTKEQLKFLEYRKKVKEQYRTRMKKGNSNSIADSTFRNTNLLNDNYGCFFGDSKTVIAPRVIQAIQESKTKSRNKVSSGVLKPSANNNIPPEVSENAVKAQKLKVARDYYSFLLSDDVELPAPKKESPSPKTPVDNSEGQPAQVAGKSKQPFINGCKIVRRSGENRKRVNGAGHLAPKSGSKSSSTNKFSKVSTDSRKQLSSNSGNGSGRPVGSKSLPSKMPVSIMGNKSLTPGMRNHVIGVQKPVSSKLHSINGVQRPLSSKLHSVNGVQKPLSSKLYSVNGVQKPLSSKLPSSVPKQSVEQRKDLREQNKPKMISKQSVASTKAQINKPLKQIPKRYDLEDHHPKNKVRKQYYEDDLDEMDFSSTIRRMFNYNSHKFDDDDDDVDDMEAGFDEIMKEERRSAKIAKKEDEEQLRLIEEEERRRRLAKKRKLR
ncbi:hypothetical protein Fmac_002962 [Flemingia macrophylla]|uniref:Protein SPT2 homolog n=1 Tax=Flemingia macrophylla TaxID=520843 RepID=A0ABD1NMU7_9FABA